MIYEVQTRFVNDWENVWTDDGEPHIFPTYTEAAEELADFLEALRRATNNGNLSDFNPDDYRIRKIEP
jgi:hypothetical protein